jgi:hypothetical protein
LPLDFIFRGKPKFNFKINKLYATFSKKFFQESIDASVEISSVISVKMKR